jgi:hypothetical protein
MPEGVGSLTKLDVARRLLGMALWLYLEDLDPVSVHTLTGAASELAEQLVRDVGDSPFIEHVLSTNPDMTPQRYYALARQYYNAFKHLTTKNGEKRDDDELLSDFDDYHNDALLFVAWTDFMAASSSAPIEAQVFQAWFYASHPEKMARREDGDRFLAAFPPLDSLSRAERKIELKRQIAVARQKTVVMTDPRTDQRPLIWKR